MTKELERVDEILDRIKRDLRVIKWMLWAQIILLVAINVRLFFMPGGAP